MDSMMMRHAPQTRSSNGRRQKVSNEETILSQIESDAQAAVDASVEFARQGRHPDPEAGVMHTQAEGPVMATQFYNRRNVVNT